MRAVARAVARVARTATRGRRARAMPARADASARHRACERCRGEGATFALSRAQKKRRRLERDDGAATREAPEKRVECAACEGAGVVEGAATANGCLLYTSPSPRDRSLSRMPSSA